ncbi:regulator of G protein signaling domain-domain-containing protein [Phakopsora pachyrhizi]|uniref:Regulator of G protein signaling domain-domain-containing protein n=1 Tax=Phakopsora pachyrhizi TaxID=170000 RepID=A0AAV0BN97_PHAPC|nr:regulator of G protein signaling domain-domain-containing protein [Phakopsora pachyrhizi]
MTSSHGHDPRPRQQSTSHILKTGKRGNPFVKDTHDLFSTLVASLQLGTNTRFFRSYPNSFTTDDAAANLASLRFSQSNRSTDPSDPSRIVTTTTTTTFSMNRDIAKGICQHFMDARLIENAADPLNPTFKERGIYQITPKGLHVLERFITKNGIHADHLVRVFTTQPICMKLLHLERRPSDDEIHITPNVINVIFKRFSGGRNPNYVVDPLELQRSNNPKGFLESARIGPSFDRSLGVELQDVRERSTTGATFLIKHVFSSTSAIDWLVDFSTCCAREEAAEILAHFVRYSLITLHVRAPPGEIKGIANLEGDYRYGSKITYRITDEGRRLSGLEAGVERKLNEDGKNLDQSVTISLNQPILSPHHPLSATSSSSNTTTDQRALGGGTSLASTVESQILGRQVLRDILHLDSSDSSGWIKDATSSTARLKAILEEPALRSLFRDFLRSHICEENLHYWIDVQEFRRRFATSSSAVGAVPSSQHGSSNNFKPKKLLNLQGQHQHQQQQQLGTSASSAMEQHQEKLVTTALLIFNTYLAPGSPSELNIDHNLRADVISYMSKAVDEAKNITTTTIHPTSAYPTNTNETVPPLRATQVQALLRHYERIADHIYRLMATDQVPKFIRTEKFLEILSASNSHHNGLPNDDHDSRLIKIVSPTGNSINTMAGSGGTNGGMISNLSASTSSTTAPSTTTTATTTTTTTTLAGSCATGGGEDRLKGSISSSSSSSSSSGGQERKPPFSVDGITKKVDGVAI